MGEEVVKREECLDSMQRIHQRVDEISKCSNRVENSALNIEKSINEMHHIMYGSEKGDGLITRHSNLNQKVSGIYFLGGVIIVSLIGALITMLVANFNK